MDKITLPKKTKLAAKWMLITGGGSLVIILMGGMLILNVEIGPLLYGLESFLILLGSSVIGIICFLLPAFFLLKRKIWAWKFAIITLLISMVIFLFGGLLITLKINWLRDPFIFIYRFWPRNFGIPFILALIPFILLLLDRKNFWKSAS